MPITVSSAVKQLSDGNTNGTILGRSSTDLIGFYGLTQGVAQASGAAQAALVRGTGGGAIATAATSQSPAAVSPSTSAEVALTLGATTAAGTGSSFTLASTDVVMVNKPTSQAGIGLGQARVSGTTVAVAFSNFSAATVTPTAGEKYGIVALRGLPSVTQTLTPAPIAADTTSEQIFTVTGARVGDVAYVSPPSTTAGVNISGVRIAGPNQIAVAWSNASAATVTPAAGTYTFFSIGGIDTSANVLQAQINAGVASQPTATTTSAQPFTMTGLAATDTVIGVTKPTVQANIAVIGGFVSAANSLGVTYISGGALVTPTNYEVYGVTVYRPQPAAPAVPYSQALAPASVGPNTTNSQLFTVTGVVANSMLWVNKPSTQPGLGIQGVRATSNSNQIEITYANATSATITPTQNETYAMMNFQQAVPDPGNLYMFQITPQQQQDTILTNAIRSAMVGTSFIAGA